VVKWLKENHYENHPYVKALVVDAVAQLNKAAEPKKNYEKFAKEGKWKDAFLWAEQYFQYQVKAADAGLRAKKLLKEKLEGNK
jgi:nitrous-oxide reductase